MWKTFRNISSAAKDMVAIASKEVMHQVARANELSGSKTDKLAEKARAMRETYEVNLASRKEGIDGVLVVRRAPESTDLD